jgi:hypothetical protein
MRLERTWITATALVLALAVPVLATGGTSNTVALATGWNPGAWTPVASTAAKVNNAGPVGVTFEGGSSGIFRVKSNIHPADGVSDPSWSFFHIDTDDRSGTHRAEARIYRTPNGPFSGTGTRQLVASVASTNGTGYHTDFSNIAHAWDFDNYVYWIELFVQRGPGAPNITVYRIVLHV